MATTRVAVRSRSRVRILNAGAHRGARENVAAYREHNARSAAATIVPVYVDPVPGRAEEMAERAEALGVHAEAIEGRAEDVIDAEPFGAVVCNLDNPMALSKVLAIASERRIAALAYMIVVAPGGRMFGPRLVLPAGEAARFDETRALFEALGRVTERSGARAIFGERARGDHSLLEPLVRTAFAEHCRDELSRLVAGVLPEHPPVDVTFDGEATMPLLVHRRGEFGHPVAVVVEAARTSAVPLRRGRPFLVAEVAGDAGIRLHEARRRQADGRLDVRESTTIDEESFNAREI